MYAHHSNVVERSKIPTLVPVLEADFRRGVATPFAVLSLTTTIVLGGIDG